MLHLQKPRLGSRKRETHDRPNYPVRRSPTTAAHTLPQRGSNPGQVTYRIAPTNTNEPNSAETETYFPLYFLPSSEKYFFLDHEAGHLLYHRNLVKSHPKQLFWLRTLVKKSFCRLYRDDRPHGARAKMATKMLRPLPSMRQTFFWLISTAPALPSFAARPQLSAAAVALLWVQLFFLSLDGASSRSHRRMPNTWP